MKKVLLTAAAALTAIAAATPAAAQGYYGGYPQAPYGNAYGYNNYGQVRAMQARVDAVQRHIANLDRRRIVTNREARNLQSQARNIEQRLRRHAYGGLSYGEMRDVETRLRNLEWKVQRDARDGHGRYGNNWNGGNYVDHNRNGVNDHMEPRRRY